MLPKNVPGSPTDPAALMSAGKPNTPAPPPASASPSSLMSKPQPTLPQVSQTLTAPATPADLMTNPAVHQVAHDASLGKFARELFTGEQTNYTVDPQTGKMVATTTKEKPGQLFRSIVAGALLGGFAGSKANDGFVGGVSAGGTAVMQHNEQQDALRQKQAQQDFQNKMAVDKERNDTTYHNAQISLWNAQQLRADANLDLHEQQFVSDLNDHNQQIALQLAKAGAKVANIPNNGQVGNGSEIQNAIRRNPSLLKAPSGLQRVWTAHVNYSGLKFGEDDRWENAKTGKPVDLATRTTWTGYDVQPETMKQSVTVHGADLNKLGFSVEPDQDYTMSMGDFLSMQRAALSSKTQKSEESIREGIISKRALNAAKVKGLQTRIDNLYRNELYKSGKIDPAVQSKIDGLQQRLDGLLGVQSPNTPPPPPPNPAATPSSHVFSKSAWLRANPNGDINAAVRAAEAQHYTVVN